MIFNTLIKKYRYCIYIVATILLSSCYPAANDSNDQDALKDLPHFEYLGYTYYIHPHLAIYNINRSTGGYGYAYKDWESSASSLDSYGFNSWFIPSVSELIEAANIGLLQKDYGYYSSDGHHLYFDSFTGSNCWVTDVVIEGHANLDFTVVPMIKLRME